MAYQAKRNCNWLPDIFLISNACYVKTKINRIIPSQKKLLLFNLTSAASVLPSSCTCHVYSIRKTSGTTRFHVFHSGPEYLFDFFVTLHWWWWSFFAHGFHDQFCIETKNNELVSISIQCLVFIVRASPIKVLSVKCHYNSLIKWGRGSAPRFSVDEMSCMCGKRPHLLFISC